jgi:signal transduction histidine kinase
VGHERLGVLSLYWRHARPISEDESRLLTLAGNTTAQSIARAQLYEAEQRARHVADNLRTANMTLTQSLDMVTVVETLLKTVQEIIPYDSGNVMMMTEEDHLILYAHRGYEAWTDKANLADIDFNLAKTPVIERSIKSRQGIIINDAREDPDWVWVEAGRHIRSWLCIPLIAGGNVVGIYSLDKTEPNFFTESHRRIAESFGAQAASAIQNALLYREVTAGQERLRTLTRRLVEIQETERSRVAKSLHEGVGQYLTGLSLRLKASTQVNPKMLVQQINDVRNMVDELTTQVREISLALRPTLLDDMGLQPALDWLFERYEKQNNLKIDFVHRDLQGQRLSAPVETAAFRILQEILTDVVEHRQQSDPLGILSNGAPKGDLRVRVWTEGDALHILVIDPDRVHGLAEALNANSADNLNNLKERISLLDGDLTMDELSDGSTRISAFIPLASLSEETAE